MINNKGNGLIFCLIFGLQRVIKRADLICFLLM